MWKRTDERDLQRGWAASYTTGVTGARAAALMRELRPWMMARRRAQIDRALERYAPVRLTRPPRVCTVAECARPHRSRGLCHMHHMTWSRDRALGRGRRVTPLR